MIRLCWRPVKLEQSGGGVRPTGDDATGGTMIAVRFFQLVQLTLLIVLLTGCSLTKLVNLWTDPRYTGPPFKKILVIGIGEWPGKIQ